MYPTPSVPIRYLFDGGNLGLFSVAALGRLRKIEEIVITEPESSNLSLLKRNCALIDEATVLYVALDERGGSRAFTVSTEPNEGKLTSESDSTEGRRSKSE